MKQTVNLYQASLAPRKDQTTLDQLLGVLGILTMIMLGLYVWLKHGVDDLQEIAAHQQIELQTQQDQLQTLQTSLEERKPSEFLQKQLQQIQQSSEQRKQLLQLLQKEQSQEKPNFEQMLSYLVSIDQQGIWLTSLEIGAQGLLVQGVVQDPALVPKWLVELGKYPYFQGQSLGAVEMRAADQGYLTFEVGSAPGAQAK